MSIFKKTLRLDQLPSAKIKDGDVLQVVTPQTMLVVMTQEHYLRLHERLEQAEGTTKTSPFKPKALKKAVAKKTNQLKKIIKSWPR